MIVFEETRIQDKATYTRSRQYAEGIEHMLINGVFVIKDSKLTGRTPGWWLKNELATAQPN